MPDPSPNPTNAPDAPARRRPKVVSKDVAAIADIDRVLADLDEYEQCRVLTWLNAKYTPSDTPAG